MMQLYFASRNGGKPNSVMFIQSDFNLTQLKSFIFCDPVQVLSDSKIYKEKQELTCTFWECINF